MTQLVTKVVSILATTAGRHLFDLDQNPATGLTAENLDDAATADLDDPNLPGNQAREDAKDDQKTLAALRAAMAAQGTDLAVFDTVATPAMFTTKDGTKKLKDGSTVEVLSGYTGGGKELTIAADSH